MDYPRNKQLLMALIETKKKEVEALEKELSDRDKLSVRDCVEIIYSLDKSAYYVTDGFNRPRSWLSVESSTERPTEPNGLFGSDYVQIIHSNIGTYYRKAWNFAFWSIKSGEHVKIKMPTSESEITPESELIKDYVVTGVHNWDWQGWS